MGWETREIRITGHVSRHNSFRDRRDDILWEEVCDCVRRTLEELKTSGEFDSLNLDADGLMADEDF